MTEMRVIPPTVTPKDLADATGWSERSVRRTARALNACLGTGRGMRLTAADVQAIMEEKRCPSRSTSGARSTTTGARFPVGDYEVLRAQRTKSEPKELRPRKKPNSGNIITMDRARS